MDKNYQSILVVSLILITILVVSLFVITIFTSYRIDEASSRISELETNIEIIKNQKPVDFKGVIGDLHELIDRVEEGD